MSEQGRIVWHDLMSTEPEQSEAFFTQLFGWQASELDMGPAGKYRMLNVGGKDIGGIVPLDKAHGVPSHWLAYVAVDDVDAAAERARGGGGDAVVPPTDISGIGRFCVVRDPAGGHIAPWKRAGERASGDEAQAVPLCHFCWEELLTRDVDGAKAFYGELFGWTTREMDMGPAGVYTIFSGGGRDRAGCMPLPPGVDSPSHWLSYVSVDDVDAVAAKAKALGGCVYAEPRDIVGVGRFSVASEASGAVFAVYKRAEP